MTQIDQLIISAFTTQFLKYGIPILLVSIGLSYLSSKPKRRRKLSWPRIDNTQPKVALADLNLTARRPLTPYEEAMFIRLYEALPECTVLSQVSFQALLDTPQQADRNRFDRKYADFVICSKRLTPIAVIELDDASHNTKLEQDADRDAMLQKAGYQTIRYRQIPAAEKIQQDIEAALKNLTGN
jgi:very-short-patch-repair endonuclease